jgi:trans-L-3-hydroxyproline dehydratase
VLAADRTVEVPGIGPLKFDVAFGGAFYAYCQAADAGVGLTAEDYRQLIQVGMDIKHAVMEAMPIPHPFEKDLSFLYGTIFIGPPHDEKNHSRNVCIFAEGEVDRCPTGTGVSGRAAIHYQRGEIGVDERFTVESIIGSTFTGRVLRTTTFGEYEAVVPEVEGTAHITGRNEWLIDPDDALRDGFILR